MGDFQFRSSSCALTKLGNGCPEQLAPGHSVYSPPAVHEVQNEELPFQSAPLD